MSIESALQRGWKSIGLTDDADAAPDEAPAEPSQPTGTFIGSGALFEGTLKLCGDFQIDSEFRGELSTDGTIVVGPSGSVVGDIVAREVEIFGAVVGDVSARRQLILHPGSRLHGGIETACLEIQKHAFFSGATTMTEPQAASRRPSDTPANVGASPVA
ncbi:MAG: bactofilin family protein [Myxococcota bacterium]